MLHPQTPMEDGGIIRDYGSLLTLKALMTIISDEEMGSILKHNRVFHRAFPCQEATGQRRESQV